MLDMSQVFEAAHFHSQRIDICFFTCVSETMRILSTLLSRKRRADGRIKHTPHPGVLFSLPHGGGRHQFRHILTLAFGALWGRITGRHQEHFKAVWTVVTLIFVNRHYLLRKKLMGNLNCNSERIPAACCGIGERIKNQLKFLTVEDSLQRLDWARRSLAAGSFHLAQKNWTIPSSW